MTDRETLCAELFSRLTRCPIYDVNVAGRTSEPFYKLGMVREDVSKALREVFGEATFKAAAEGRLQDRSMVEQPQASSVRTHAGVDDVISGPTGQSAL